VTRPLREPWNACPHAILEKVSAENNTNVHTSRMNESPWLSFLAMQERRGEFHGRREKIRAQTMHRDSVRSPA
jgi:hypothetical protein